MYVTCMPFPHRNRCLTQRFQVAAKYYRLLGRWLDEGSFKPNKVRLIPGGLAGVGGALKELQEGKVHGEKLVYRIAQTPQIKERV